MEWRSCARQRKAWAMRRLAMCCSGASLHCNRNGQAKWSGAKQGVVWHGQCKAARRAAGQCHSVAELSIAPAKWSRAKDCIA